MRSHRSICFFSGVLLLRASTPQKAPRKMFRNFTFPERVQKLLESCPKTFWKFLSTFPGHCLDNVRGKNALKSKTRSFCIHIFISFKSSRLFIHYCCKFVSKCDIRMIAPGMNWTSAVTNSKPNLQRYDTEIRKSKVETTIELL